MERRYQLIVLLVAIAIYFGCIVSPPTLMDDVDAVQAQIARNMLDSGDWVTARLNGVAYLEKSPLIYWSMAVSYAIFGVHDWAARIPLALGVVLLCWLTARFARWAFNETTGLYAGLILATSIGLWLFTRIQIPDAILTATITLAMWSFLQAMESGRAKHAYVMAAAMAAGLLLKGLIAMLFPLAAIGLWLTIAGRWSEWRKLRPFTGLAILLMIAAPWHVLATLRNPPYFDFTMKSEPGQYHGFFWFYFFNEHVFRFLNMRWPRDYNTVPRHLFWLFHLLWLFPWSALFPAIVKLRFRPTDRAGATRLLALCWTGFLLLFFTFSTTQEYYSMPCYPALALLLANALERDESVWIRRGQWAIGALAALAAGAIAMILVRVNGLPTPGDISRALTQNPDAYTLSLGHMGDLTIDAFAYLRLPLVMAGIAFLTGAYSAFRLRRLPLVLGLALMMTLFLHAARTALVTFDPYLGSRPLAMAYMSAPRGTLIVDNQYYTFSSIFFYANPRRALLLNGRVNNLEYASYAPGAPQVFIDDPQCKMLWESIDRFYLVIEKPSVPRVEALLGKDNLHLVRESGGKYLFTNRGYDIQASN
ncbi:MAG TPA: glycosyltransferase family 39 protein [Bryobacteraceae bacterium]|nr:glycosyltransferase family 39 protein [Bryobacteraceae bacterium]